MTARSNAIWNGLSRGWTEFMLSLRSPQDQGFYLFIALLVFGYLFFNRNTEVEGTTLSYPTLALPSILGAMLVFSLVIGPAYSLAMEREDGTLLRARATPHGLEGYVSGQVLLHSLGLIPSFAIILIPGAFLFEGLMSDGLSSWLTMTWVIVLGLLATLPVGIIIGSLAPSVQKVGTWGMFPILTLLGISGIFFPIQELWEWVQVVAQAFPMYWVGLGMRSALLPDAAAALEIGGSWRTLETVLVLAGWAFVGLVAAPKVLGRMARRQSGSHVEQARQEAMQWVR